MNETGLTYRTYEDTLLTRLHAQTHNSPSKSDMRTSRNWPQHGTAPSAGGRYNCLSMCECLVMEADRSSTQLDQTQGCLHSSAEHTRLVIPITGNSQTGNSNNW